MSGCPMLTFVTSSSLAVDGMESFVTICNGPTLSKKALIENCLWGMKLPYSLT